MIKNQFLISQEYTNSDFLHNITNSTFLLSLGDEDRSKQMYTKSLPKSNNIFFLEEDQNCFLKIKKNNITLNPRSQQQLTNFFKNFSNKCIYFDITGLTHYYWVPMIRAALQAKAKLNIIYIEPKVYSFSQAPTLNEIYDLSQKIKGISPLPSFTNITISDMDEFLFIPLLGFEGTRLQYVMEKVQPNTANTYPIIGVPGFQIDYPFNTYYCNKSVLEESTTWKRIRFAKANCPFSLFYSLLELKNRHKELPLKIAPIGTKPHAVGAVLFALYDKGAVELIYDHPVKKPNRTRGIGKFCMYPLTPFFQECQENK